MKKYAPLLFLLCLFVASNLTAQNSKKTDVNRDINLAKVYEQLVKEGYGSQEVYLKLANEHYFQGNYQSAKKWFEKVFEQSVPTDEKLIFRYKQTLRALKLSFKGNPYVTLSGTR